MSLFHSILPNIQFSVHELIYGHWDKVLIAHNHYLKTIHCTVEMQTQRPKIMTSSSYSPRDKQQKKFRLSICIEIYDRC